MAFSVRMLELGLFRAYERGAKVAAPMRKKTREARRSHIYYCSS
jgi:hypothetical protein